jgi:hypothetical protein
MSDPKTTAEVDSSAAATPSDASAPVSPPEELSDAELDSVSGGLTPSPRPSGPVPIPYPNTA